MKNPQISQSVIPPSNDNQPLADTSIVILPPPNKRRKDHKKNKRRGGYADRGTLSKKDRTHIDHYIKIITEMSRTSKWLITINPTEEVGETPQSRKARIRQCISYIGTLVRRKGHKPIFMSVYEWPKDGAMHAHVVIYIPQLAIDAVRQFITKNGIWEDVSSGERYGEVLHAIPFNPTRHRSYLSKERTYPCRPQEWKPTRLNQFRPRPGVRFRGKRVCPSNGLLELAKNYNAI